MVASLEWYIAETRKMISKCTCTTVGSCYHGSFNFVTKCGIRSLCREVHIYKCRELYRSESRTPTKVGFGAADRGKPEQLVTQFANMMRGIHLTEADLGFTPAKFTLTACRIESDFSSFEVVMEGDYRWHHAIPVYSVLITDARRYFLTVRPGRRLPRSLTHRLIVARGLINMFGRDGRDDWMEHRGYNGRVSYERCIKWSKSRREELNVVRQPNTRRWVIQ